MDKINERGGGVGRKHHRSVRHLSFCHKKNRNEQHVLRNFIAVCIKRMWLIDGMHLLTSTDAVGEKEVDRVPGLVMIDVDAIYQPRILRPCSRKSSPLLWLMSFCFYRFPKVKNKPVVVVKT